MTDIFETETVRLTRAQVWYVSWTVDLLVYTVVLNLFDEYVAGVTIGSFTLSILTAALLKVMLVLLHRVENRLQHYFERKGTTSAKIVGAVLVFVIVFAEEYVILDVVSLVFGDEVELGQIMEVFALILTMMIAQRLMIWGFRRLGEPVDNPDDRLIAAD